MLQCSIPCNFGLPFGRSAQWPLGLQTQSLSLSLGGLPFPTPPIGWRREVPSRNMHILDWHRGPHLMMEDVQPGNWSEWARSVSPSVITTRMSWVGFSWGQMECLPACLIPPPASIGSFNCVWWKPNSNSNSSSRLAWTLGVCEFCEWELGRTKRSPQNVGKPIFKRWERTVLEIVEIGTIEEGKGPYWKLAQLKWGKDPIGNWHDWRIVALWIDANYRIFGREGRRGELRLRDVFYGWLYELASVIWI